MKKRTRKQMQALAMVGALGLTMAASAVTAAAAD